MELNEEMRPPDPEPKYHGGKWQYFPTRVIPLAEEVHRRIDFLGISEVSRFASALMSALVVQEERIALLEADLSLLRAQVRKHVAGK